MDTLHAFFPTLIAIAIIAAGVGGFSLIAFFFTYSYVKYQRERLRKMNRR